MTLGVDSNRDVRCRVRFRGGNSRRGQRQKSRSRSSPNFGQPISFALERMTSFPESANGIRHRTPKHRYTGRSLADLVFCLGRRDQFQCTADL
jgi:hypothetical protein